MTAETEETGATAADERLAEAERPLATPVYQKPVLRKYDQIAQVKPYGPSEMEAG